MRKQGYMVVEHPIEKDTAEDFHSMVVHIHHHLGNYNWARLDDKHVLLLGTYSASSHNYLHSLATVTVLPHASSTKPVANILKEHHYRAVQSGMPIEDHHTMSDLIEHAEVLYGPLLSPDV